MKLWPWEPVQLGAYHELDKGVTFHKHTYQAPAWCQIAILCSLLWFHFGHEEILYFAIGTTTVWEIWMTLAGTLRREGRWTSFEDCSSCNFVSESYWSSLRMPWCFEPFAPTQPTKIVIPTFVTPTKIKTCSLFLPSLKEPLFSINSCSGQSFIAHRLQRGIVPSPSTSGTVVAGCWLNVRLRTSKHESDTTSTHY